MVFQSPDAFVYVDGWNFYHGINSPGLHPLGFCNFWKLGQSILGSRGTVKRVHYFTAKDQNPKLTERQNFWLDALRSVGITVGPLGYFQYDQRRGGQEEKTTDVRLALQIAEDAQFHAHKTVLLISADADFIPALQLARKHNKVIKIVYPPRMRCQALEELDGYPVEITERDLRDNLLDGELVTARGVPLRKALEYGWACKLAGQVQFGSVAAEDEHWQRWPRIQ